MIVILELANRYVLFMPVPLFLSFDINIIEARYQMRTMATGGKKVLTSRHSLTTFSEPRPRRTLELVRASINGQLMLLEVLYIYSKFFSFALGGPTEELTRSKKQQNRSGQLLTE